DMKLPENKRKLYEAMETYMATDRARHTLLPISKFGLMSITRQRLRPELNISTAEVCPSCKGTGKIGPSIIIGDEIERDLQYLIDQGHRQLSLHVNPIIHAYLTKGRFFSSLVWQWYRKYNVKLKLVVDNDMPIAKYHFYDRKTEDQIKL